MAFFSRKRVLRRALRRGSEKGVSRTSLERPLGLRRAPSLKTLTSLNKEVRPFFLCDNSIWSFPSVSFLSVYSIWRSRRLF